MQASPSKASGHHAIPGIILTAVSGLLVPCLALSIIAAGPAGAAEAAGGAGAEPAAGSTVAWPLVAPYQAGELRVYHPHVESLKGDRITARAAFSMTAAAGATPVFGVVWLAARATIDRENRTVALSDQQATKVHLPAATGQDEAAIATAVTGLVKGLDPVLSLDRILAALADEARDHQAEVQLDAIAPAILVDERRAMLLTIDGEPHATAMAGSRFERIVNTPYPLVRDPGTGACWLLYGGRWYGAPVVKGPWAVVATVEKDLAALAPGLEGIESDSIAAPIGEPVDIVVSQRPAELISIDGPPAYEPVPGTVLLAVTNTDNDLFEDTTNQQHYVLLNGRWFHTGDLVHGSWEHVAPGALPADFAHIPPDSPYAAILVHVPGTPAANDAVLDAQVPQTAAVKRDATITVTYDGDPQWQPVGQTALSYAVNSPMDVIKVSDGDYFCCYQGVWYRAPSANGPWAVSTTRPPEVNAIPPDNPLYYDQYVSVYDATPDYVYVGYTPGYLGSCIDGGCVVWGTGFYYNGWWGGGYIPRFRTWGFGMAYNPWTGHWGVGPHAALGGRNGGFRILRGADGWWGPAGFRPVLDAHQPIDGHDARPTSIALRSDAREPGLQHADNLYRGAANRDRVLATTISRTPDHPLNVPRPTAAGQAAPGAGRSPERIVTSHEGDVYRQQGTAWEQWQREGWKPLSGAERREAPVAPPSRPAAPVREETVQRAPEAPRPQLQYRPEQLDRQLQYEDRGIQRTQQFQQYRASPPSSVRSYGGGSGGAHERR
jgi:hypothetical protein